MLPLQGSGLDLFPQGWERRCSKDVRPTTYCPTHAFQGAGLTQFWIKVAGCQTEWQHRTLFLFLPVWLLLCKIRQQAHQRNLQLQWLSRPVLFFQPLGPSHEHVPGHTNLGLNGQVSFSGYPVPSSTDFSRGLYLFSLLSFATFYHYYSSLTTSLPSVPNSGFNHLVTGSIWVTLEKRIEACMQIFFI